MIGPNLTGVSRVLGRIEQIRRQSFPDMADVRRPDAAKSRFVDVLDDVSKGSVKTPVSGKTSYEEMRSIIDAAAENYNVDEDLIRAMIQVESGWQTDALSSKGARGLMQLMPKTAVMLGVSDPSDPSQNIEGGTKYISQLMDKYNGDIEKALAAYNAGPGRIDSGSTPAVSQRYVNNVMALYRRYRGGS